MNETPLKLYSHAKQGQPKTPAPGTVAERVRHTLERLHLDDTRGAEYLDSFLPPVSTTPPRKPGRVKKLAREIDHVEKSGLHESTVSLDNSIMSENPV
jgi:hypothetical protein